MLPNFDFVFILKNFSGKRFYNYDDCTVFMLHTTTVVKKKNF